MEVDGLESDCDKDPVVKVAAKILEGFMKYEKNMENTKTTIKSIEVILFFFFWKLELFTSLINILVLFNT